MTRVLAALTLASSSLFTLACEKSKPPPPPLPAAVVATASTAHRLTREQYINSIDDLLSVRPSPESVPHEGVDRNGIEEPSSMSAGDLRAYLEVAETIVRAARANGSLHRLMGGCSVPSRSCAEALVRTLGPKLFRRDLSDDEVTSLLQGYDLVRSKDAALDFVLEAMLVSPSFLYVGDIAAPPIEAGLAPLEPHALAARLAYFLWQSSPDDELLDAADQGRLSTRDDVVREARRLIDDVSKSDRAVRAFARRWLDLEDVSRLIKSAVKYKGFDANVAPVLGRESELFVADVILHGDARFETLFTARYTFVSATTAPLYGLTTSLADGSSFVKVDLDATRAGILTQLPFLALTSHTVNDSPTLRGHFIRERLLCDPVGTPPASVNVAPPPPDETVTVREQYKQHVVDPNCRGCHGKMDPIGVGFARYDAVGEYAPYFFENNTHPTGGSVDPTWWELDDSGEVFDSPDMEGPFHGPVELSARLAESRAAQDCFVAQAFQFAVSRQKHPSDEATLTLLKADFQASNHNIRDLLVSIAASDTFRSRAIAGDDQ